MIIHYITKIKETVGEDSTLLINYIDIKAHLHSHTYDKYY